MTRGVTGEQIVIRPSNNVYTALAAVAVVVQIIGLIVIFVRAQQEFGGLF